jgi:gliding motility-associated-like protein
VYFTSIRNEYQFTTFGEHEVSLISSFEQCAEDTSFTIVLEPVEVPNIITPNGDRKNDLFITKGTGNSGPWKLDFFNRWGDHILLREDYQNDWSPIDLEDGVYYYLLTAPDDTFCKGWVYIVR